MAVEIRPGTSRQRDRRRHSRNHGPLGSAAKKLAIAYHFARTGGSDNPIYECGTCEFEGYYHARSCKRHPRVGAEEWWRPEYRQGKAFIILNDISSSECPVTLVDDETKTLLDTVFRLRLAARFGSGQSLGPLLEWPAWLLDAINVIEAAETEVESRLMDADKQDGHR